MKTNEKKQKLKLLKFLSMLYANCEAGFVEIRPFDIDYNIDFENRTWIQVQNKKKMAENLWDLRHGHLFYGIATRTAESKQKQKGTKEFLKEIPALFGDLDVRNYLSGNELREILNDFPFQPSSIVFSGHGLHVYYFLEEPVNLNQNQEKVEKLLKIVQSNILRADATNDSSRCLRVPYSHNVKVPSKPKLVKIIKLNDVRHNFQDFVDQYWELLEGRKAKKGNFYSESNRDLPTNDRDDIAVNSLAVPERIKKLIREGKSNQDKYETRSEADMGVICSLLSNDYENKSIKKVFQQFPDGIGEKYHEKGSSKDKYLEHSINSAREFLSSESKQAEVKNEQV